MDRNVYLRLNRRYATNRPFGIGYPWVETHGYRQAPLRGEEKYHTSK